MLVCRGVAFYWLIMMSAQGVGGGVNAFSHKSSGVSDEKADRYEQQGTRHGGTLIICAGDTQH